MSFLVRFWGVRGSIPTPGRTTKRIGGNTSCVDVRWGDELFICDAGTGIRELGSELMASAAGPLTAHFFFSHMHWDHIQGFPFFTPVYLPQNTFHVHSPVRGDDAFHKLLSGQMESRYFPVAFRDLSAKILPQDMDGTRKEIAGVRVTCFEQRHPGTSWAWSFERDGVKVVYATDNEIDLTLPDPAAVERDPQQFRRVPPGFVQFCRDADLLIADGQYSDAEYPKKVGWGHTRATTLVDLAIAADVKQLALFHHDPLRGDADVDAMVSVCRERAARFGHGTFIFAAREGLELRIDGRR